MNLDSASDGWTCEKLEVSIAAWERLIAEGRALARRQRRHILLAVFLIAANAILTWRGFGDWWASCNAWDGTFATVNLLSGVWLAYFTLVIGVPSHLETVAYMRHGQAQMQRLRVLLAIETARQKATANATPTSQALN